MRIIKIYPIQPLGEAYQLITIGEFRNQLSIGYETNARFFKIRLLSQNIFILSIWRVGKEHVAQKWVCQNNELMLLKHHDRLKLQLLVVAA